MTEKKLILSADTARDLLIRNFGWNADDIEGMYKWEIVVEATEELARRQYKLDTFGESNSTSPVKSAATVST